MFAVIFEVKPFPELHQDYLDTAKALRPLLNTIDGVHSIDRYENRQRPGWLLSLSYWADEASLTEWRTREKHHFAQVDGRERIFGDYRIRVAQVISEDAPGQPRRSPQRRSAYNDLSRRKISYMGFLEVQPPSAPLHPVDLAQLESTGQTLYSLYNKGKLIHMQEFPTEAEAAQWRDSLAGRLARAPVGAAQLRVVEVERDYTLMGRAQAPQYYPAAQRIDP